MCPQSAFGLLRCRHLQAEVDTPDRHVVADVTGKAQRQVIGEVIPSGQHQRGVVAKAIAVGIRIVYCLDPSCRALFRAAADTETLLPKPLK